MDFISEKIKKLKKDKIDKEKLKKKLDKEHQELEVLFNKIYDKTYLNQIEKLLNFLNQDIENKNEIIRLTETKGKFTVTYGNVTRLDYRYTTLYLIAKNESYVRSYGLDDQSNIFEGYALPQKKDEAFKKFIDDIELIYKIKTT